jgi:hypothetical protein
MIPPLVGTRCRRAAADMRVVAIFEHLTAVCLLRVTRVSLPRCPFPLQFRTTRQLAQGARKGHLFCRGYSSYFADSDGFLWEVAWNPFTDLT